MSLEYRCSRCKERKRISCVLYFSESNTVLFRFCELCDFKLYHQTVYNINGVITIRDLQSIKKGLTQARLSNRLGRSIVRRSLKDDEDLIADLRKARETSLKQNKAHSILVKEHNANKIGS